MNREIKFRGKRIDNGDWVYGGITFQINTPGITRGDCIYEFLPKTVGQYTGLKDKNGKQIYEGDIIRILYTDWPSKSDSDERSLEEYLIDISHVGKVVFEELSFKVSLFSKQDNEWRSNSSLRHGKYGFIEVIGNVFDNPELLK